MRTPITHGELGLIPVSKLPELKNAKRLTARAYIASHSETGHHHMLTSEKEDIEIIETDTDRYAIIGSLTRLWHDKSYEVHEEVMVEPGIYKLTQKNEYDPFNKIIRRVFD